MIRAVMIGSTKTGVLHPFETEIQSHAFYKSELNTFLFAKIYRSILKLLAEGMTAPELAEKLHLSQLTVESHRRNIMAKLKVKNTAMLIRVAVDNNLI